MGSKPLYIQGATFSQRLGHHFPQTGPYVELTTGSLQALGSSIIQQRMWVSGADDTTAIPLGTWGLLGVKMINQSSPCTLYRERYHGGGRLLAFVRDSIPSRSGLKAPWGGGGIGGSGRGAGGGGGGKVSGGGGPGGAIWGGGWGGHRLPLPPLALPLTIPGLKIWDRAGGGRNTVQEISKTNEVRTGKWMRAAQKGLKMSRIPPLGHHNWTRIIFGKP